MEFANKLWAFCQENHLLSDGEQVVCAVSGGADSMALLWAMYLLREEKGLVLSAAHFNHGLRGEESDRDEDFVREFCEQYQIALSVGRGQVQSCGKGLEDAARRARYGFLESLDSGTKIATAHTADDNAETILLHMLRGTGLKGLGGIAPQRGRIIRPMLGCSRKEVEQFLFRWGISHIEDSSNGADHFLRNRLRHEVMPVLKRENPSISENTSAMALRLRMDQEFLNQTAQEALCSIWEEKGIRVDGLLKLHPAIQARVISMLLQKAGVREPEAVHIKQALELAESQNPSARKEFPQGVVLRREYQYLVTGQEVPALDSVELKIPGVTRVGPWEIQCRYLNPEEKIQNSPFTFTVAYDRIGESPVFLRKRQTGDRLRLSGGSKSVKKLFIDRKIPAHLRDTLPVVTVRGGILGVAGLGANLEDRAISSAQALQIIFTYNA